MKLSPINMPDSGEAFEASFLRSLLSVFSVKNVHGGLMTLSQIIITVS